MNQSKNYVQWIREKVGHEKIMLVHAGGCIFNEQGEVLLQRRGDCNMWGFPGGALELGETPQIAAIREVKEETGLDVEIGKLIGVYTDCDAICPNGDKYQSVCIAYELSVVGGELYCDNNETLELKYFPLSNTPELFCKQHEELLEDIKVKQYIKQIKPGDENMIKIDAGDFFLIEPSEIYAEQIAEYKQAFLDTNCSMDGCGPLRRCENPTTYISECRKYTDHGTLPDGWVLATQFFYIRKADNRLVGMIQVRHYFNDYLSKFGGHIGYSIKPNERRKGYATSMLSAILPYCKEIGLDKILISCIDGNIGSEKTILNNGGVYESTVYEKDRKRNLKRFWITL